MIGPLTYLDFGLIAVSLISALLAMYRGLTRELLSITSWAVAALAAVYFVLSQKPLAEELAPQMGAPAWVAQVVIGSVIFLVVLVIVHLITLRISDTILESRVGMVDRILGFFFGVARGFLIVLVCYMFYEAFFPNPDEQFPWVREAQSLPALKSSGETLKTVLMYYVPSSLTAPTPGSGEQQGFLNSLQSPILALAPATLFHICVTRKAGPTSRV